MSSLFAVPSPRLARAVLDEARPPPHIAPGAPIVSLAKGIEQGSPDAAE